MPDRHVQQSTPEAWHNFDASNFAVGDYVTYFDPADERWHFAQLDANPRHNTRNKTVELYLNDENGAPLPDLESPLPPKRIHLQEGGVIIRGQRYEVDRNLPYNDIVVDENGNAYATLWPVDATGNTIPDLDELPNMNLSMLEKVQRTSRDEAEADTRVATIHELQNRTNDVATVKRKEFVKRLNDLEKTIEDLINKLGSWNEWNDRDDREINAVKQEAAQIYKKVDADLEKLRRDLDAVLSKQAEAGNEAITEGRRKVAVDLDGAVSKSASKIAKAWEKYDKEVADSKKIWDQYDKDKKAFDDAAAAPAPAAGGKPPRPAAPKKEPTIPTVPRESVITPPTEPRDKNFIAAGSYNSLATHRPPLSAEHAEIIRLVTERFAAWENGVDGTPSPEDRTEKTGEIFLAVLEEMKNAPKVEAEPFDFAKEKEELETEAKALWDRASDGGYEPVMDLIRNSREDIHNLKKKDKNAQRNMAEIWKKLGNIEITLFKKERKDKTPNEKVKERDIDIPDTLVGEIIQSRPQELFNLMLDMYRNEYSETGYTSKGLPMEDIVADRLKNLFAAPTAGPAGQRILADLARHGIRDWNHFTLLWEQKYALRASKVLHETVRADINNDTARHISGWDKARAMLPQLAKRIVTTAVLVGGCALGASVLVPAGATALVAGAAVVGGGTVGGAVRGVLQKFWFGRKVQEDRDKKTMEDLTNRTRDQRIQMYLAQRFNFNPADFDINRSFNGGTVNAVTGLNNAADTVAELSALIAEATRVAGKEAIEIDDADRPPAGIVLTGDALRTYVRALAAWRAREHGREILPEEKKKLAETIIGIVEGKNELAEGDKAAATGLTGEGLEMYINVLKKIRREGDSPNEKQKKACALAIARLTQGAEVTQVLAAAGSDPIVIRLFDGIAQGFSGQSAKKYGWKGVAGTAALGGGMAGAFLLNSGAARAVMGAIGGGASGYHMGEGIRKGREYRDGRTRFDVVFTQTRTLQDRFNVNPATLTADELNDLADDVRLLNRWLKNNADTIEDSRAVDYINQNPVTRKQLENLVYEAYNRGVFARLALEKLNNFTNSQVLGSLESDNLGVKADGNISQPDKDRERRRILLWRIGSTAVGALAGAGLAWGAGELFSRAKNAGADALREKFGIGAVAAGATVPGSGAGGAEHVPGGRSGHGAEVISPDPATSGGTEHLPTGERPPAIAHYELHDTRLPGAPKYEGMWRAIESFKGDSHFKGMSNHDYTDWLKTEMERMGYKFLDGTHKIAHPFDENPGDRVELFVDGEGNPHVRFLNADGSDKVAMDHYNIETRVGGKPVVGAEIETKFAGFNKLAHEFADQWNKPGADHDNLIKNFPIADLDSIKSINVYGERGSVVVEFTDNTQGLYHPVKALTGNGWILQSGRENLQDVFEQGVYDYNSSKLHPIENGGVRYYELPGKVMTNGNRAGQDFSMLYDIGGNPVGYKLDGLVTIGPYHSAIMEGNRWPVGTPAHIDVRGEGFKWLTGDAINSTDQARISAAAGGYDVVPRYTGGGGGTGLRPEAGASGGGVPIETHPPANDAVLPPEARGAVAGAAVSEADVFQDSLRPGKGATAQSASAEQVLSPSAVDVSVSRGWYGGRVLELFTKEFNSVSSEANNHIGSAVDSYNRQLLADVKVHPENHQQFILANKTDNEQAMLQAYVSDPYFRANFPDELKLAFDYGGTGIEEAKVVGGDTAKVIGNGCSAFTASVGDSGKKYFHYDPDYTYARAVSGDLVATKDGNTFLVEFNGLNDDGTPKVDYQPFSS